MKAGVSSSLNLACAALLGALSAAGAARAQQPQEAAQGPAGVHNTRPHAPRVDALEQRVQLLTHELALDARQQQAVRQILQGQREAVQRIWQDPAIDPAERAPAVRFLGERTAERIRAVLNDEQKKKYNKALPDGALSTQANVNVEGWLKTVRGQSSQNPLGVPLPSH